jgi:hypothetical protein
MVPLVDHVTSQNGGSRTQYNNSRDGPQLINTGQGTSTNIQRDQNNYYTYNLHSDHNVDIPQVCGDSREPLLHFLKFHLKTLPHSVATLQHKSQVQNATGSTGKSAVVPTWICPSSTKFFSGCKSTIEKLKPQVLELNQIIVLAGPGGEGKTQIALKIVEDEEIWSRYEWDFRLSSPDNHTFLDSSSSFLLMPVLRRLLKALWL